MNEKNTADRQATLTFATQSDIHRHENYPPSASMQDGEGHANLRLTQIVNPLKRAFHSKLSAERSNLLAFKWSMA